MTFSSAVHTVKTRTETWRNYEAGELVLGFCNSPSCIAPFLSVSVGMGDGARGVRHKTATQKGQHSVSLAPQQGPLYRREQDKRRRQRQPVLVTTACEVVNKAGVIRRSPSAHHQGEPRRAGTN